MSLAPQPLDFKALFEKSPVNYLVLTPDFRIVAATDGYCRVARAERSDLVGRSLFDLFTADASRPDAGSVVQLRASLERVVRSRRPDVMPVLRYDLPRPAYPGELEEKHWSTSTTPVLDASGQLLWIVYRVRDVTRSVLDPQTEESQGRLAREQDQVIARLRMANDQLAALDSIRSGMAQMSRLSTVAMMASALAHDVSQPLTAARNYLGAFRRGRANLGELQTEELLVKLEHQIDRAGDIVRGLRTFMAVSTTVHKREDIAAVIADTVRLTEGTLRASGVVLTTHVAPDLPQVSMDRVQVQQCLINLVTNAAEAMASSPRRAIDIDARVANGALQVSVSDTGPGLPEDIRKLIEEPFATTTSLNSGLGLPICRQIVREHHGAMAVTPNRPGGAVIVVTIPLANGRS